MKQETIFFVMYLISFSDMLNGDCVVVCVCFFFFFFFFRYIIKLKYPTMLQINVREHRRDDQKWTIQRNRQYRLHKTKKQHTQVLIMSVCFNINNAYPLILAFLGNLVCLQINNDREIKISIIVETLNGRVCGLV